MRAAVSILFINTAKAFSSFYIMQTKLSFFIKTSVYYFVCKAHEMQAFIFPAQTQVNTKFCFHVQKLICVKHDCSRPT